MRIQTFTLYMHTMCIVQITTTTMATTVQSTASQLRDDEGGHYTCSEEGMKLCIPLTNCTCPGVSRITPAHLLQVPHNTLNIILFSPLSPLHYTYCMPPK